jgi:muconate cycloisomerase
MVQLTAESGVPVVAHESVFTLRDGAEAARRRLADIWAVTPSTHGGVLPTLDLLSLARAHGIPCLIGSTVELGIATALMAHLGAATPEIAGCPVPSDVIGPLYHDADIVQSGVRVADGATTVGDGPGLGVRLDEEAVERFRVRA